MTKHIFLTGDVQTGKSTMIKNYLSLHPEYKLGGFLTITNFENKEENKGSVHIVPATGGGCNKENLCLYRRGSNKPDVNNEAFNILGVAYINKPNTDLILMDEIGNAEKNAEAFKEAIRSALNNDTPILGVIKPFSGPIIDMIRNHPNVTVIKLDSNNRNLAWDKLLTLKNEKPLSYDKFQ